MQEFFYAKCINLLFAYIDLIIFNPTLKSQKMTTLVPWGQYDLITKRAHAREQSLSIRLIGVLAIKERNCWNASIAQIIVLSFSQIILMDKITDACASLV